MFLSLFLLFITQFCQCVFVVLALVVTRLFELVSLKKLLISLKKSNYWEATCFLILHFFHKKNFLLYWSSTILYFQTYKF